MTTTSTEIGIPKDNEKSSTLFKTSGFEKKYEMQKKKEHDDLWKKVSESPELEEIVRLKEKIEQANIQRNKTTFKINEMKKGYDNVKKDIQGFIREQSSAFHKLNYPKRNKLKKKI